MANSRAIRRARLGLAPALLIATLTFAATGFGQRSDAPIELTNPTLPSISGTLQVGSTLTASPGVWNGTTPITFTYQWLTSDNNNAIPAATDSTFEIGPRWEGNSLYVRVIGTNSVGPLTARSNPTGRIKPPPGTILNVIATITAPTTVETLSQTACATVHVADKATGDPIQATYFNIQIDAAFPQFFVGVPSVNISGSTNANGDGTACYSIVGSSGNYTLTVTNVVAGGRYYFRTNPPDSDNTVTSTPFVQRRVIACGPILGRCPTASTPAPAPAPSEAVSTTTTQVVTTTTATTTTPTTPSTGGAEAQELIPVTIAPIKIALLSAPKPAITVITKTAVATVLHFALMDAGKHTLASWTRSTRRGSVTSVLRLPLTAQKAGKYLLKITSSGKNKTDDKTVPVTLRA